MALRRDLTAVICSGFFRKPHLLDSVAVHVRIATVEMLIQTSDGSLFAVQTQTCVAFWA